MNESALGQPFDSHRTATLPVPQGHDHASLAMLPFSLAVSESAPDDTAEFAFQMLVDGKVQRVAVELSAGKKAPLPNHGDQLVFLGLLQLAMEGDTETRLGFRRTELLDVLQWPREGWCYDRLRESLERLTALVITVRSSMVARDGREYSKTQTATHIVDAYHIGSGRSAPCWVEWGHLVKEAFRLGDFKRLDWNLVLALKNPLTAQLYRLLDRVTLSGEERWEIGWRPLASALGMRAEAYSRPARFRQVLEPHLAALVEHHVIDSWDYQRGGTFVFHVHNYLRAKLRTVLEELKVYPEAARQLVAGHDETVVMSRCDCHQHGQRGGKLGPGALVNAIREPWELRYPDDEAQAFLVLWEHLGEAERAAYHAAGIKLCGGGDSLFDTRRDPTAWTVEMRAVVRFMVCWGIDAEQV